MPLKLYFILKRLFLTRNTVSKPPGKYPWQELFKSPQALIFFWSLHFQNLGLTVVLPLQQKKRGIILWYQTSDKKLLLEIKCLHTKRHISSCSRSKFLYNLRKWEPILKDNTFYLILLTNLASNGTFRFRYMWLCCLHF